MRRAIWDALLDADLNVRYWSCLSRRYHFRDKTFKVFLACISSGTVASWGFWSNIPVIWKILSAISAVMAIASPLLNWPKMIESMVSLIQKWSEIRADYDMLWFNLNNGKSIDEIEKEYKKIKQKEAKVTQQEYNLPNDKRLLNQCRDEVLKSRGLA